VNRGGEAARKSKEKGTRDFREKGAVVRKEKGKEGVSAGHHLLEKSGTRGGNKPRSGDEREEGGSGEGGTRKKKSPPETGRKTVILAAQRSKVPRREGRKRNSENEVRRRPWGDGSRAIGSSQKRKMLGNRRAVSSMREEKESPERTESSRLMVQGL